MFGISLPGDDEAMSAWAVTVVGSAACHYCEDAETVLADLATRVPIEITQVDAGSVEGRSLLAEHGAGMLPLVLLDGGFFSSGRIPRGKLRDLAERAGDGSTKK